jgi:predicted membrane chloride channel (bestrophin family)
MNELRLALCALIGLGITALVLWFTRMPQSIESTDVSIMIALGIGLLILVVDKRQDRHLHQITKIQHNLTLEIREVIEEQLKILRELQSSRRTT